MSDSIEYLIAGFAEGVHKIPHEVSVSLDPVQAHRMGLEAAYAVLAPMIWAARVGETLETTEVTRLLRVSRQALAKRVAAGTLLGLPGRGTTHYPVWQFDFENGSLRPDAREIFEIFVTELGKLDAYALSVWMNTPSSSFDGLAPCEWLVKKRDPRPVFDAARRVAGRLAS
ncbi:hypothetical protein [Streptomyces griseorubiginosus]|uniref:hypothetical protein n=1 Tax=Streptomyces griseorubiginosus TaxID=67304 RepID=UPI002E8070A7|nr:hypothetical protein [Streptomyces griseorubiginosus]WUB43984.1 hypothetical protein OHN19_11805 [Streptomyces griseorubiginosus]WUB52502.1 hypothetical protein OG942_11800 [Streptomyces griseorubiginosus]